MISYFQSFQIIHQLFDITIIELYVMEEEKKFFDIFPLSFVPVSKNR